jgi:hypothetical protein
MITVRFPILLVSLLMMADTVAAGCEQLSVDTSQGTVRDGVTRLTRSRCRVPSPGKYRQKVAHNRQTPG